jgi:hypothetical protein
LSEACSRPPFSVQTMKTTFYTLLLKLLDATFVLTSVEDVLDALGAAVERAKEQLAVIEKAADSEYIEAVNDEVNSFIEQILGAAFVVCQTSITQVVSTVMTIRKHVRRKSHDRNEALKDKAALMKLGPEVKDKGVSKVAAIDAFANYFKHESEWSKPWANLKGQQARTADVVGNLGARQGSTGNLRAGAEALGNGNYSDMRVFASIVEEWRAAVQRACRDELKTHGMIT